MPNNYQIRKQTEITVPHKGNNLTFIHSKHGPDTYANVEKSIKEAGLITPTMAETASLVHTAFHNEEPEFLEIKELMKNNWLWTFTGILYVPNKGAYIQDLPEIRDGMLFMEESELVNKLEANDPNVRFVPFGFQTEEMTAHQLATNPYVIALAGEEGADKLAQVADKYRNQPYLFSFQSVEKPLIRVSARDSLWYVVGRWLGFGGYVRGDGWGGCAFGVKNVGEASTPKKE